MRRDPPISPSNIGRGLPLANFAHEREIAIVA